MGDEIDDDIREEAVQIQRQATEQQTIQIRQSGAVKQAEKAIRMTDAKIGRHLKQNADDPIKLPTVTMIKPETVDDNPRGEKIDPQKQLELKDMFLMDGITYTQAAILVGCSPRTAKNWFLKWAEELVEDPGYEPWVKRQARVRARTLEGITKQIIKVNDHMTEIQQIYDGIIKDGAGNMRKPDDIDHSAQRQYASQIKETFNMLSILRAESAVLQAAPPPDVVLDREIEQSIATRTSYQQPQDTPESGQ